MEQSRARSCMKRSNLQPQSWTRSQQWNRSGELLFISPPLLTLAPLVTAFVSSRHGAHLPVELGPEERLSLFNFLSSRPAARRLRVSSGPGGRGSRDGSLAKSTPRRQCRAPEWRARRQTRLRRRKADFVVVDVVLPLNVCHLRFRRRSLRKRRNGEEKRFCVCERRWELVRASVGRWPCCRRSGRREGSRRLGQCARRPAGALPRQLARSPASPSSSCSPSFGAKRPGGLARTPALAAAALREPGGAGQSRPPGGCGPATGKTHVVARRQKLARRPGVFLRRASSSIGC